MLRARVFPMLLLAALTATGASFAAERGHHPFSYNYAEEAALADRIDVDNPDPARLREIFAKRRERVMQAMPEGAMIVFSVERAQERRLEFQVPDSDNHDFTYLTGLDGIHGLDSALLLLPEAPGAEGRLDEPVRSWVVLYTSTDPVAIARRTGIGDVRPLATLEHDLSVAMTDFRDWRITQVRRWPLAAALSRAWGRSDKVLYFNYPRFFRLGMPEPVRLEHFERIRRFSPEMRLRDSADILDQVRQLQDSWSIANLRRSVAIVNEGVRHGFRGTRPGMTEKQVMETIDFVYRYGGRRWGSPLRYAAPGWETPHDGEAIPEGWIEFVPRSGGAGVSRRAIWCGPTPAPRSTTIRPTFSEPRPSMADSRIVSLNCTKLRLDVQKTVIAMVRPGVTWWELHDKAMEMLRDAGGYDEYYYYGIGHFIGMDVHDEGDYLVPFRPGMALAIEQGVMPPEGPRVAFEDDVLVTEDGHDWLSRDIPIEIEDVVELTSGAGVFDFLE